MSSPSSPKISTSSDNSLNTEVYADELAQIMEDPYSLALTVAAFDNDPTGTAILQLFSFITDSMDRTRREMMRLHSEWEEVFKYAIENDHFRRTMWPIIRNHHEWQNQCSTPSSSPLQPLFDEHSLSTTNIYPPPSVSGDNNSPQTNEILSPEPTTTELTQLESPSTVFLTVNENKPGTQQNPIDMDQLFVQQDTPHSAAGFTWQTNSNLVFGRTIPIHHTHSKSSLNLIHCRVCDQYGHHSDRCIQMGALICSYCWEVGHGSMNCSERRWDERRFHPEMQFCLVCNQPGHSVDNCHTLQYPSQ